ncbi:hypothetical protein ACS3YM_10875 [Nocardia sp. N13]|uniref:hypothetical protein n=1 Tax=Nocardioides sp. N13(2025) TaxID=3453405 RepID=UPI003F771509
MRRKQAFAAAALAIAVLLSLDGAEPSVDRVAATAATCDRSSPQPPSSPVPHGPDFPTNATGLTYGSAMDNAP